MTPKPKRKPKHVPGEGGDGIYWALVCNDGSFIWNKEPPKLFLSEAAAKKFAKDNTLDAPDIGAQPIPVNLVSP